MSRYQELQILRAKNAEARVKSELDFATYFGLAVGLALGIFYLQIGI